MLFQLLERQAADRGDRPAVIHGGETVSWSQLLERATRLSTGLAGLGVGAGDTVGVLLPNSTAFITALLALARIGAQAIPLHLDLKTPEIRAAIRSANCTMLLATDSMGSYCRELLADGSAERVVQATREEFGLPSLARLGVEGLTGGMGSIDGETPLFQILTSGTTGRQKRVVRSQAALRALASAYCETALLTSSDRILCVIPLHYGHGLCAGFLAPLYCGAPLYLEAGFDRRNTLRLLREERITGFSAPPFLYSVLAETRMPEGYGCPDLRLALTGGGPLHRDVWKMAYERLGFRLRQFYGASETGLITLNMDDNPEENIESAGRPIAGVRVSVQVESGELAVKSPGAATWSAPLEAGEPLTKLADAEGWIHMPDTGRFDAEGRLFLTGRTSRVVNIAGRKVNPLEVEEVLASHPGVTRASVIAVGDSRGFESAKAIVYCAAPCSTEQLIAYCGERLAGYKVPRVIELRDDTERLK